MTTYTVLRKPLTPEEMSPQVIQHDGRVKGVVAVKLWEVIECDSESFLDIISTRLAGSDMLQDFAYKVVGHDGDTLHIEVEGDASEIERDWPDRLRRHEKGCPAVDGGGCRCGEEC